MITDLQHPGKYELQQRLAHNSTAEVWKSYDSQLKRPVAMKFFRANAQADPDFATRFVHRAEVIASLHHPNIVQVHDFGLLSPKTPGAAMAYLVMDYVEGQKLTEYVRSAPHMGKVPPGADILRLVTSISMAIDYAHLSGVIHGNLKPANIFLPGYITSSNQIGEPLITDFGIVGLRDATTNTFARRSLETALYISPEQAKGLTGTERSDIYSLGVILFELCTGVLPFQGNRPIALMMQHLNATPTPPSFINPSISPALNNVILRCLAKDPEMRFPHASTLAATLAKALNMPVPEELYRLADQTGMYGGSAPVDTPNITSLLLPVSSSPLSPSSWPDISISPPQENHHASFTAKAGLRSDSPSARSYQARRKGQRSSFLPFSLLMLILVALVGSILGALLLLVPGSVVPGSVASTNSVVGHAYFVSSGQMNGNSNQGIIDEMQVDISNVAEPAVGKSYYAWLLGDKNQSEAAAVLLGKLDVFHGNVQFLYRGDRLHTNLLQFTSRFLVTEEDAQITPSNPSPDTSNWRYYAEIPQTAIPGDKLHFSILDHFRHLLVESPELSARGLNGGMAIWLLENARRVLECANGAKDAWARKDAATIRSQMTCVLDYLDGIPFVRTDVPSIHPLRADAHFSQVALLGSAPHGTDPPGYVFSDEVPPGYVYLIGLHLNGAALSPQATPDQRKLAGQIDAAINKLKYVFGQAHQDAKMLVQKTDAQLLQSSSLTTLNDLVIQAQNAYAGQLDPSTGASQGGAIWIYGNIERLVTFDVMKFASPSH
jgi:eukaryotic-like serine/threonine-protein kinase